MISAALPAETPASESAPENSHPAAGDATPVRIPFATHGVALWILATIALIFALDWAQSFLITLILGILFAYTLNPLVTSLERFRIARVAGSSLVMLAVIAALVFGAYMLRGQGQRIFAQLPEAASKLSAGLDALRTGQFSNMRNMQTAANTIEKATNHTDLSALSKLRTTHIVIDQPAFKLSNFLWIGSRGDRKSVV